MRKVIRFFDKMILKSYNRTANKWYNLPTYLKIGKFRISIYAMNMDFKSLRIKIQYKNKIILVLKKGIY